MSDHRQILKIGVISTGVQRNGEIFEANYRNEI
jgi:hypothetical protein